MSIEYHATWIFGGILLGGVYGLIALGLAQIFGVSRILNVAHGDFLMLGALLTFWVTKLFGVNPFLVIGIVFPIFLLVGFLINIGFRPLYKKPPQVLLPASILVTLGLSMVLEDVTSFSMGTVKGVNYFGVPFTLPSIVIGGLALPTVRVIILLAIVMLTIVLHLFIKRTLVGKCIRAYIQNREVAVCLGVIVPRITALSLGVGTALAASAGLFMALITNLNAFSGLPLTVKALTIIIIGGMGSFIGAIVGGIILGLVESYVALYIGGEWSPATAAVLLILILLLRPQGIFGKKVGW